MKLLLVFLLFCFISGLALVKIKPAKRASFIFLLCLLLSFAYYFLNKI
jgi:hypothetical protein